VNLPHEFTSLLARMSLDGTGTNVTFAMSEAAAKRLPFVYWSQAFDYCAKVIREHGRTDETDLADALECKVYLPG
jgi:hypothetical protein